MSVEVIGNKKILIKPVTSRLLAWNICEEPVCGLAEVMVIAPTQHLLTMWRPEDFNLKLMRMFCL